VAFSQPIEKLRHLGRAFAARQLAFFERACLRSRMLAHGRKVGHDLPHVVEHGPEPRFNERMLLFG
jgi:hypothetical protein